MSDFVADVFTCSARKLQDRAFCCVCQQRPPNFLHTITCADIITSYFITHIPKLVKAIRHFFFIDIFVKNRHGSSLSVQV